MAPDILRELRRLSDAELEGRVRVLAARERGATASLVAHLAELDTREVHFRAGHGSLFAYCREVLCLAEQEAYNRIAVARSARRFPVILDLLESGALSLTTARLLGPHLTAENHQTVLEGARGKTKAQVEEMAAALWPRPDAPTFIRKLPTPASALPATAPSALSASPATPLGRAATGSECAPPGCEGSAAGAAAAGAEPGPGPAAATAPGPFPVGASRSATPNTRSAEVTPLAPDRYKVQVTIGAQTLEKLKLAKDLLRHALPSGDEAVILDRALTALLEDLARRRFAATDKPRASGGVGPGSRHVPAEVRRRVWLRDAARCAFVGASGRRCSERGFLEFHHVRPHALGGEATVDNIQLRCRSHNAYEARLYFDRGDSSGMGTVREPASPFGGEVAAAQTSSITPADGSTASDQPVSSPQSRTRSGTSQERVPGRVARNDTSGRQGTPRGDPCVARDGPSGPGP